MKEADLSMSTNYPQHSNQKNRLSQWKGGFGYTDESKIISDADALPRSITV
ncbi:hypothetical protein [Paenibacillus shenyangensis]|uniref:hypothetical protein n=1 Tax=Paenibacillus sp. A9 TaxID=1284352 RepID=UPI000B0A7E5B|nr:hypothetical protein [Paenibacillus sp. A9]